MIRLNGRWWIGTALAAVIALATPSVVSAQVIWLGKPGADPRGPQVKSALEKLGYKVEDVGFRAAKGNDPALWVALTAAKYAALTASNVLEQGLNIWIGISGVIGADNAVLIGGQVWTKYIIEMHQSNEKMRAFSAAWEAAKTDDDRKKALDLVLGRFTIAVFDLEKGQYVDAKDFVNKNFTNK